VRSGLRVYREAFRKFEDEARADKKHADAFNMNAEHGKYQCAFLASHMLAMSVVYLNIWQIELIHPGPLEMVMVGFSKDVEKNLMAASSPFVFSAVNERSVLRFLK
jgi:hypothetical protein